MCNWSEIIKERSEERGEARGFKKGVTKERIEAIERMIKANITREQIVSMGYTEAEYEKAESALYANA